MQTPPIPTPSRRSTQSEAWSLVSAPESIYTEPRAPQLNGDNMSSNQIASASASDGLSASLAAMSHMSIDPNTADTTREAGYDPAHIAPSNTDTAGTDDTLVGANPTTATTATTTNPTPPSPILPILHPGAHHRHQPQLTRFNVDFQQHQLTQCWTGNMDCWVAGAGIGDRLVRVSMSYGSGGGSVLDTADVGGGGYSTGGGRSGASSVVAAAATAAAAAAEWQVVPLAMASVAAAEDVVAAGAWTFDAAAGHRRWSVVSVDDEY